MKTVQQRKRKKTVMLQTMYYLLGCHEKNKPVIRQEIKNLGCYVSDSSAQVACSLQLMKLRKAGILKIGNRKQGFNVEVIDAQKLRDLIEKEESDQYLTIEIHEKGLSSNQARMIDSIFMNLRRR